MKWEQEQQQKYDYHICTAGHVASTSVLIRWILRVAVLISYFLDYFGIWKTIRTMTTFPRRLFRLVHGEEDGSPSELHIINSLDLV